MKLFVNLIFCTLLTINFIKAQIPITSLLKSNYFLISEKSKFQEQVIPSYFEERISSETLIERRDSFVSERFIRFKEKGIIESEYTRKYKLDSEDILHWKDNTAWIEIDRKKKNQTGLLCGKKGVINQFIMQQKNPSIPATEIYTLENDSTWFIVFKPELNCVELESMGITQRRYMLGHIYENMGNIRPGIALGDLLNKQFSIGDKLQLLYTSQIIDSTGNYFLKQPIQIMEHTIIKKGNDSGNDNVTFSTCVKNIKSGTRENLGEKTISLFEDGITIGNDMMIGDTLYKSQLKIMKPSNQEIQHPFYPLVNLYDPLMIAFWNETDSLKNKTITYNCFWTNNYPGRICWFPDFPVFWNDNGESIQGQIVYYKKDTIQVGEEYSIPTHTELHIDEINLYKNELSMKIVSEKATDIRLSIFKQSGEEIKLDKSIIKLDAGFTQFSYVLPNIQMNETILIKLTTNNKKNDLIQEYRIMSRENN
jgi:hypothetical protein